MKRVRTVISLVVVLGLLTSAIFRAREPRYQGRTLTEWILDAKLVYEHDDVNPESDPKYLAAKSAVEHIGPNAIPVLLSWVQAEDSLPKLMLIGLFGEGPHAFIHIKRDVYYHWMASTGFLLLRSEAKPAWSELVKLTHAQDISRRSCAFECLLNSAPDKETLVPVLIRLSGDPDANLRSSTRLLFRQMYPKEAEAAGFSDGFSTISQSRPNQPDNSLAK